MKQKKEKRNASPKIKLIQAVNDMRDDAILLNQEGMITNEYRIAYDDACLEFLEKIKEILPNE